MSNTPSGPTGIDRKPSAPTQKWHYPFWFGGSAASMAAVVTHPLDLGLRALPFSGVSRQLNLLFLVKVRLQTRSPSDPKTMLGTFVHVFKKQGFFGLYNGLSAALFRQLTYSTVRFGVYEDLKARFHPSPSPANPKGQASLPQLLLMSSTAGFLGGIAGNPGDVLNVRMQSDFAKPADKRRNYKHALEGLMRMIREEGPASVTRGIWPNSARALLMTSSQLASYDMFKQTMIQRFHMPDNVITHFLSSLAAGFVATTICSPVDVVKTRIMSAGGKIGILSLLKETTRRESWIWMFRGWVPSFVRLGPQTIATMMFFEQHKKVYRTLIGGSSNV
jgi:solute carrier family 25 (mitochondrial dicarboxylate transporter), member 10